MSDYADSHRALRRRPDTVGPARGSMRSGIVDAGGYENGSQLVVIGSSAGGIEALSRVVATLPADFPAPIVIAQHLDPRRPSHLAEILARHATLPIKVVDEPTPLEDGAIFVVPSNRLVEVGGRRPAPAPAEARHDRALGRPAPRERREGLRPAADRGDPDRDGIRRLGRGLARQEGGRHGRHREPRDGHVPVDAGVDLAVAGRRASRTSTRSAGPLDHLCSRRTGLPRAATDDAFAACSTGSANGAGSTSARTSRPPSCAGCAAG